MGAARRPIGRPAGAVFLRRLRPAPWSLLELDPQGRGVEPDHLAVTRRMVVERELEGGGQPECRLDLEPGSAVRQVAHGARHRCLAEQDLARLEQAQPRVVATLFHGSHPVPAEPASAKELLSPAGYDPVITSVLTQRQTAAGEPQIYPGWLARCGSSRWAAGSWLTAR